MKTLPKTLADEIEGLEELDARALKKKYPALLSDAAECAASGILRSIVAYRLQERHYGRPLAEDARSWLEADDGGDGPRLRSSAPGSGARARLVRVWKGVRHEAIIDDAQFDSAQKALASNRCDDGTAKRHTMFAPLKGILRCGTCGGSMTPVFSNYSKGGGRRRYVYYRCTRDAKKASGDCPIKSISADTVERFVYEQLGKVLRRDDVVGLVTGGDAVKRADFMETTKDMDDFWARMNPGERERLLRLLVRDVRIWPDKVVILLALDGDDNRIEIPCRLQTNLGRQHFVVDEPEPTPDTPALAVPKALRQARRWLELLASGTYQDKKQLADALGFNGSYFGKMLRFPFLSPVIVEKIRNGELPEVSVTKLMTLTSPLWLKQHKELGIE